MEIRLIDGRLKGILPAPEYDRLEAKVEALYLRLANQLSPDCQRDFSDLMLTMRDLEVRLTDRCITARTERKKWHSGDCQGTMATLA